MNGTPGLSLTHHRTVVGEYATTLNRDVSWIEWSPDDAKQNKPYRLFLNTLSVKPRHHLRAPTRLPRFSFRYISRSGSLTMEEDTLQDLASQDINQETTAQDVFIAPSIHERAILAGASYTYHSAIPEGIAQDPSSECVLGVDEAGRGPVLGTPLDSLLYVTTLITIKRSYGLRSPLSSSITTPIAPCPDTSFR